VTLISGLKFLLVVNQAGYVAAPLREIPQQLRNAMNNFTYIADQFSTSGKAL